MKLQITITEKERELLAKRASLLGYSVTKFTKYLLSHEAMKEVDVPIVQCNQETEDLINRAIIEDEAGKTQKWVFGKYGN